MRDCRFSSVMSGLAAREYRLQCVIEAGENFVDGDGFVANSQVLRQLPAVVDRALRGIRARHAQRGDVLRAQRADGDRRHQSGVDAAAQRDHHLREAAFAHVVARAQRQRLQHGLVLVSGLLAHIAGKAVEIGEDQVLFKALCLRNHLAVGSDHQARSVKDQAVVAAHLIHHHHRRALPLRNRRQHLAAAARACRATTATRRC